MPRPLRHLGHPLLTLALLATICLDTTLWHALVRRQHSALIIPPHLWSISSPRINPRFSPRASIFEDGAGTLVFHPISPMGKDGNYLPPSHTHIADLTADIFPTSSGLIAPVVTRNPHTLIFHPAHLQPSAAPTSAQLVQARALYADHLSDWLAARGDQSSPIPALLAAGDGTLTEINTLPLINDILLTPILLLAAASTTLSLARITRRIRRRFLPPHLCPTCRYDLTGLPPSTPCPECGQ